MNDEHSELSNRAQEAWGKIPVSAQAPEPPDTPDSHPRRRKVPKVLVRGVIFVLIVWVFAALHLRPSPKSPASTSMDHANANAGAGGGAGEGLPEAAAQHSGFSAFNPFAIPGLIRQHLARHFARRQSPPISLWRVDLQVKSPRRTFMNAGRITRDPQISPDGKKVAFSSNRSGRFEIWVSDSDGGHPVQETHMDNDFNGAPRWSPDGRSLVFTGLSRDQAGIFTIDLAQQVTHQLVSAGTTPGWSRDGKWVYYGTDEQIWRIAAAGGTPQQTAAHGQSPAESPDGKFLYFVKRRTPGIWKVPVEGGEEQLMIGDFRNIFSRLWTVSNDGIYFVDTIGGSGRSLDFFSFKTNASSMVTPLPRSPQLSSSLTVSPDGSWALLPVYEN